MPKPEALVIDIGSPAETDSLARRIAPALQAGDTLLLEGPIGAGKTHFARSLIKARLAAVGRDEDVPSPTFTLVQSYDAGGTEIWHADLYRVSDPAEVIELGLDEAFERAICLVEWPDRLGSEIPGGSMLLRFEPVALEARRVTIASGIDRWRELTGLQAEETGAV